MKRIATAFLFFICAIMIPESPRVLRAPVWIYLEPVPGNFSDTETEKSPPLEELQDVARFILSGMSGGWNFSYTPADIRRNVREEFELEPILHIHPEDPRFSVDSLTPVYPRLTCWAQLAVDNAIARRLDYWNSISFSTAKGRGTGERIDETAGIRNAYTNAVLHAVRNLARSMEKNKPREISGEVLLRSSPRLFSDQGRFIADVRVLINIREIVPYTLY